MTDSSLRSPESLTACLPTTQESIAVTQNYVSAVNLPHVLSFLATESEELISGCCAEDRRTLHRRFLKALQASCPEVGETPPNPGAPNAVSGI